VRQCSAMLNVEDRQIRLRDPRPEIGAAHEHQIMRMTAPPFLVRVTFDEARRIAKLLIEREEPQCR
jgi:hypothetical protein